MSTIEMPRPLVRVEDVAVGVYLTDDVTGTLYQILAVGAPKRGGLSERVVTLENVVTDRQTEWTFEELARLRVVEPEEPEHG